MIVLLVLFLLVIVPAVVAFFSDRSLLLPAMIPVFDVGARIVYQRQAVSNRPVSGARDIRPSERGEFYYYNLVNYLRVTDVLDDGRVIAVTRDNRRFCFPPDDSHFRKASLIERFSCRRLFPHL